MKRGLWFLALAGFLAGPTLAQQPPAPPADPAAEIATTGLTVTPVPAVVYDQLQSPDLKPGFGVVVEQVVAKSAAFQAGLRRHDILLSFKTIPVRDVAQLAQLLRTAPPDQETPLLVLRGGKVKKLEGGLSTKLLAVPDLAEPPKGLIKAGGPPAVHVVAQPLKDGKMVITFTYYGKSKLERLTCRGTLDEIQDQVQAAGDQQHMSARVRDLVDATLKRIRMSDPQP